MPIPLRVTDPADTAGNVLRSPPHNYEAERALLGAILVSNRAFERVNEYLIAQHFADPVNGRIHFDSANAYRWVPPLTYSTPLHATIGALIP